MVSLTCKSCGKVFEAKRKDRSCCSDECSAARMSDAKTKVTVEAMNKVEKLRKEGMEILDICYEVKLSKVTVCKIISELDLKLTSEQRSQKMQDRWDKVERYDELGRLKCSKCQERKMPEEFSANKQNPTGRRHSCKECDKKVDSLRWEKRKQARKEQKSPSEEGPNS